MSKFIIESPEFKTSKLTLEIESFFKGPVIKLNGQEVKLSKGKSKIRDDLFVERKIALKSIFYELPHVAIDETKYYPMGKLTSVERIFVLLPFGLVGIGGAIGGGLGALAAYSNCLLMREYRDSNLKYLLTLITSILAYFCWFFLLLIFNTILGKQ
jgi:hypothetical protein